MNHAALESFRQIAAQMGCFDCPAPRVESWVWEKDGAKVYTTKERAQRYAETAGGTARFDSFV